MRENNALAEKRETAAKVLREILERMGIEAEVSAFDDGERDHPGRTRPGVGAGDREEGRDAGCAAVPGQPDRQQEAARRSRNRC